MGEVIGDMVATVKHDSLGNRPLLLVRPVTLEGEPDGETIICVDTVNAGPGDRVLVNQEGRSAGDILGKEGIPVRSLIVAVVDEVETGGETAYRKDR